MIRIAVPSAALAGRRLWVPETEAHHLRVRRVGDDRAVEVLDGRGTVATGVVRTVGARFAIEVESVRVIPEPAPLRLLVGAADRERFSWLVEKATELGATEIVPIATERAASGATRIRDEHRAKLERRALEALKQAGGAWAPAIGAVVGLDRAIAGTDTALRWLGDPVGAPAEPAAADVAATVIIGPEGGLTDPERDLCRAAGFVSIRLGGRTLRFETAAVVALGFLGSNRRGLDG